MNERQFVEHRVGVNEDLFMLAELYYGNAEKWSIIYHANLDVIGDDPEALKPGTSLKIPLVETSERRSTMPDVPSGGLDAHYDPLISLAEDEYGDKSMAFDVRERNSFTDDQVVTSGTALRFPAQGEKHNLNLALRWRQQFRRRK